MKGRRWIMVGIGTLMIALIGFPTTSSLSAPGWGRKGERGGRMAYTNLAPLALRSWMVSPDLMPNLGLSDEQKSKISELRKELSERQAKLMVEAQRMKADLMELRMAEKPDTEKIIAKSRELMEIRMKLMEERLRFQEKVMSILTKEQREKLQSMRFMKRPGLRGGFGPTPLGPCWWM